MASHVPNCMHAAATYIFETACIIIIRSFMSVILKFLPSIISKKWSTAHDQCTFRLHADPYYTHVMIKPVMIKPVMSNRHRCAMSHCVVGECSKVYHDHVQFLTLYILIYICLYVCCIFFAPGGS